MKWGHVMSNEAARLPAPLRDQCIDYKMWKKCTRKNSCFPCDESFFDHLTAECTKVDHVFEKALKTKSKTPLCRCICRETRAPKYTMDDLDLFTRLNKTTVYKVCKRMDKNCPGTKSALGWLAKVQERHAFEFMGGSKVTAMRVTVPARCPICLEDASRIAVSRCGHYMCLPCLLTFYDIGEHKRGMLFNLISHQDAKCPSQCPICRNRNPYNNDLILVPPVANLDVKQLQKRM